MPRHRETPPAPASRPAAQAALVALLRTSSIVRRTIARAVEPAGISVAQYNVLRILRGAGAAGLPTLAIRDRMIEEAPAITRLLDKLDAAGLVLRDRGEDRRQVRCTISSDGLALLAGLDAAVSAVDETVLGAIPDPELHTLLALLGAIHDPRDGSEAAD